MKTEKLTSKILKKFDSYTFEKMINAGEKLTIVDGETREGFNLKLID